MESALVITQVKLRVGSWEQLAQIYERDLQNQQLFLRTQQRLGIGTALAVDLVLPSGSVIAVRGIVIEPLPINAARGVGILLGCEPLRMTDRAMIESALAAAARHKSRRPAPVRVDNSDDEIDTRNATTGLEQALHNELQALALLAPHQILGVPIGSTTEQATDVFVDLAKRYHPDRFAHMESETCRRLAQEIFVRIRAAYENLSRAATAAASVASPPAERAAPAPHPNALRVDEHLFSARRLIGTGQMAQARAELEAALELDPTHEQAVRQLAELHRTNTSGQKALLSKLLGRHR